MYAGRQARHYLCLSLTRGLLRRDEPYRGSSSSDAGGVTRVACTSTSRLGTRSSAILPPSGWRVDAWSAALPGKRGIPPLHPLGAPGGGGGGDATTRHVP